MPPPPGAKRAPGGSLTPAWRGPPWPAREIKPERDAGKAVKSAQREAGDSGRSKRTSDSPDDDLGRAARRVGRATGDVVQAVGRSAAKGSDAGRAAGRLARNAVGTGPSRTPKSFKRGPGGELLPIPRAHKAKSGKDWPESAPREGPELGNPLLGAARSVLGLPLFGRLPEGGSTSVEGGCKAKTGNPVKCLNAPVGQQDKGDDKDKDGKQKGAGDRDKSGDGKPGKEKKKFGPYAGVDVIGSTSLTRGEPKVRKNGKEYSSLDVEASIERKASAGIDLKLFGIGGSHSDNRKIAYQTSVEKDRAKRIAKGEKAPDPYHPRRLQKGESITLGDTKSTTTAGSQHFRFIRTSGDEEKGTTESAGVQRVGKNAVRISVGDEKFVRQSQKAGLGNDDVNGSLGSVDELRKGKKSEIDLDLSTEAGRREYRRFVDSGRIPSPNVKGGKNAAVETGSFWSEKGEISGEARASKGSVSESDHTESRRDRQNVGTGDERRRVTFEHRWGKSNLEQVARTNRNGSRGPDTTQIAVSEADGDAVNDALELRGVRNVPEDIDDEANVRVDFSNEELARLQKDVIDGLQDDDDKRSPEEYSKDERRHTPSYDERPTSSRGPISVDPKSYIAAAENPTEVGKHVQLIGDERLGTDQGDDFVDELNKLQEDSSTGSAPGKITVFNKDGSKYTLDYCGRLRRIASPGT